MNLQAVREGFIEGCQSVGVIDPDLIGSLYKQALMYYTGLDNTPVQNEQKKVMQKAKQELLRSQAVQGQGTPRTDLKTLQEKKEKDRQFTESFQP